MTEPQISPASLSFPEDISSDSPVLEAESWREAYEQVKARIARVPEENMPHINLEIPSTVTQVVGALKMIRSLRADIVRLLPDFDIAEFDKLELYAYALAHVHTRWVFASNPPELLPELLQRATVLRDVLVSQIATLSKLGLVDGSVLSDLKGPVGHRNLAVDVAGMSNVLRESWPMLTGKVAISMAELDEADKLAKSIFAALSAREQAAGEQTELNRERQRAYKLLVETYSQARRAIGFLRWNDADAERFAPSLFAGRGGPKRKAENDTAQPPNAPAVTAPATTTAPKSTLPAGHPDSEPFIE